MSNYNFTYDIPDNFKNILIKTMNLNGVGELTKFIENCRMSFDDLGFAHYAGMHGDTWNKCAVNVIIEAPFNSIEKLKQNRKIIKEWIQKTLKPNESGYLVKNIDFIVIDENMGVELPNSTEDTLITLTNDIYNALSKKEPTLVLDRLHTFSVKFIRETCQKHNIIVENNKGDFLPLHSLAGILTKYYDENSAVQSEFTKTALKSSINLFDKYNAVRNNQSYAHDNAILDDVEAEYVVRIMSATLNLIDSIENGKIK